MSWRTIAAIVSVGSSMTDAFAPATRRLTFVEFSHSLTAKTPDITLSYAFGLFESVERAFLSLCIP